MRQTFYSTEPVNQVIFPSEVLNRTAQVPSTSDGHLRHTFVPEMSRNPLPQGSVHGLPLPGAIPEQTINNRFNTDSNVPCLPRGFTGRSRASTSVHESGFPENRDQVTLDNANTVHVLFSRENVFGPEITAIHQY